MIGIIASMDEELEFIKKNMVNTKIKKITNSEYFIGSVGSNDVVLVKCYTGKVHMALTAQKLIDNFDVDILINCGVAGGLMDGIKVGDVVFAENTLQTDMDVTMLGYEEGVIPDIDKKYFTQAEYINDKARKFADGYDFDVFFGNILTADKFVSNKKDKEYLIENFNGYCTDMETAALAQVCYVNGIDFAGIRGISDGADEGAKSDFRENLKKASDNCARTLLDVIKSL